METDASSVAMLATLNQNGKSVAIYSRTRSKSELAHSSFKKEATANIEAVRKRSLLLTERCFSLITDQGSISFMYDFKNLGKIKHAKILRWHISLSQYKYEIIHRFGKLNSATDSLSRAYSATLFSTSLYNIHANFCHSGITRTNHFVKS